jgi:hypothetical protein
MAAFQFELETLAAGMSGGTAMTGIKKAFAHYISHPDGGVGLPAVQTGRTMRHAVHVMVS